MTDFTEYIREMEREHDRTLGRMDKGCQDSPLERKYVLNPLHPENASAMENGRGMNRIRESREDDSECPPL